MIETGGELALLALEQLVIPIRTSNGWRTEIGENVRLSPIYSDFKDETQSMTMISEASEALGKDGVGIQGNMRDYRVALTFNVDSFCRMEAGRESVQVSQIKADHRKVFLVPSGILTYGGSRVGSIAILGTDLITQFQDGGVIGNRTRVLVEFVERVTH